MVAILLVTNSFPETLTQYVLAPISGFKPLVYVRRVENTFTITETEETLSTIQSGFRKDAEILYFNLLSDKAQEIGLSPIGLRKIIEEHLHKINFTKDNAPQDNMTSTAINSHAEHVEDANIENMQALLSKDEFYRFRKYSHTTADKFIKLLEQISERELSPHEREEASSIINALNNIESALKVTDNLNYMLRSGGFPDICVKANSRIRDFFDAKNISYVQLGATSFINFANSFSSFFPFDERIRNFWWDYDEGNTPKHVFTVFNFIGIPFILDLTGHQFLLSTGAPISKKPTVRRSRNYNNPC